jgi:hypothetical protein
MLRGEWRSSPYLGSPAFDGVQQRSFLAAHVTALADEQFDVEPEIGVEHTFAQQPRLSRLSESAFQAGLGGGILLAQINPALACPDGVACDGHGFDQRVRVIFDQKTVDVSARVTFVGVCHNELFCDRLVEDRPPFASRRESGAAAANSVSHMQHEIVRALFRGSWKAAPKSASSRRQLPFLNSRGNPAADSPRKISSSPLNHLRAPQLLLCERPIKQSTNGH